MSLEDRLVRAREDYRSAGAGPAPGPASARRSGWRREAVIAAAAVVVVVVGVFVFGDDDGSESVDVVSPDPTISGPSVVPGVISLTVADARAAIGSVGLRLGVSDRDSDLSTATVIAQEPPAGTALTVGAADGSDVVGVRTALPVPPESADCPAMAQNRAIRPGGFDGTPRTDATELANVRQTVDRLAVDGFDERLGYRATGVYVGEGVVPSVSEGPDGEPEPGGAGHHVVVQVAEPEDCPDVPNFYNGTVVWFTIGWPAPPGSDPTPTREQQPVGAVAVHDPALAVEPDGPYTDGQEVTLTRPDGYTPDWINERPRLCAVVADGPDGPTEACDPLGSMSVDPVSSTEVELVLAQRVFTPTGIRDCTEPAVTCRVVQRAANGADRASAALEFTGDPEPPPATLVVTATDDPVTFVVDPDGLEPHPSWLELREADPGRVEDNPAVLMSMCAFGSIEPDVAPYGEFLWPQGTVHPPLAPANCDVAFSPPTLDADDPNQPVEVTIPGRVHGHSGWSDCRVDHCFIQIHQTVVVSVDQQSLTGYDLAVGAALVPFDPATPLPAAPSIRIVDDGPFAAGQTIAVEIAGLPAGLTTNIGMCRTDAPWACGYRGAGGNGTHQYELPEWVTACGPDQCYLELDSKGEGVPPLATVALTTDR